jgi:hypothetical protein
MVLRRESNELKERVQTFMDDTGRLSAGYSFPLHHDPHPSCPLYCALDRRFLLAHFPCLRVVT